MFSFGKKSEDEVLAAALLKGVSEAKGVVAHNKGELQKVYNAAGGLLQGLEGLKQVAPGFEFTVAAEAGTLHIDTNLSAFKSISDLDKHTASGKVSLSVEPDGRIIVDGDIKHEGPDYMGGISYDTTQVNSKRRNATEKALTYVASLAKLQRMIP